MPLWAGVAGALRSAIARGDYKINDLLPTELALADQFGVSRQTVRQAIAALRRDGMLSARKGVGTRVETTMPERGFAHALANVTDVFQFAAATVFRVTRSESVVPTGALARRLCARAGQRWLRLTGLRVNAEDGQALGLTNVWVDGAFAAVAEAAPGRRQAIFAAIEEAHGIAIEAIRQEIEVAVLNTEEAAMLGAKRGAPALRITRSYITGSGRLIELSSTLHPGPGFRYTMTLRRESQAAAFTK